MPKATFSLAASALEEAAEARGSWFDECLPPGVYPAKIAQIRLKHGGADNHPMLTGVVEVVAPKDHPKAKWNGTGATFNLNVTDQGGPWVRQFLDAIDVTPAQFTKGTVLDGEKPPNITKIGTVKMTGENMVMIQTKIEPYNGEDRARVRNFLPYEADDDQGIDDVDVDDSDDDVDEGKPDVKADADEEVSESDAKDDGDGDDEDETYSDEELREFDLAELKALAAEEFEVKLTFKRGTSNDDKFEAYVAAIHEAQGTTPPAADDEDADTDEDEDTDDETDEDDDESDDEDSDEDGSFPYTDDELGKLALPELKSKAREEFKVKIVRGMDRATIIQAMKDAPPF